ncbi:hypothetical protein FZEAL_9366 [Fusarium zealandicum]|uniref:HTH CENPB-type domain-containing protein n=1 Tax=Fusarium zealandicum TaxID=1053134 RepID=A0A8H4UBD2_9HYPO|nr:hypothetical protein FZEAL_9366 [Fusarium zealandicum]
MEERRGQSQDEAVEDVTPLKIWGWARNATDIVRGRDKVSMLVVEICGVASTSGDVSPEPLAQELPFYPSGRVAKNRFMKSPMAESLATWSTKTVSERGIPTDGLIELYKRWGHGKNNFGIIVTGNIDIELESQGAPGNTGIPLGAGFDDERFRKFKQLATAAKADGSLIIGQVNHPGRQVPSKINPVPISASDVQLDPRLGMTFGKPHAASKEEIAKVVEGFAHAAEYLEKAGFDGIELHAAHGYLLSQFLSRTTNKRTDEYGTQTIESRLRIISEISQAIKARVSPSFVVSAKLNSVEFQDGGVTAAEAGELCETLEALGFDFVELSGGTYERMSLTWEKESTRKREGFFLEWAETITNSLSPDHKMKMYITGGMRSVGAMVDALRIVDGVAMGRPAAAEPRLPSDIIEGRVQGTLRPVEAVENDLGMSMGVAGAQMAQVARGFEPLDASDPAVIEAFGKDMGEWFQNVVLDGDKMEYIRAIQFTGAQSVYGTAAVKSDLASLTISKAENRGIVNPGPCGFVSAAYGEIPSNGRVQGLESRLARIEEQLQLVLNAARDAQPPQQPRADQSPDSHSGTSEATEGVSNPENDMYLEASRAHSTSWKFDPVNPRIYEGPEPDSVYLPPLHEVLPIVDHYFSTFNGVIPLFQQPDFMKLLHSCYSHPNSRDRAAWAAVQIVMALGYRTPQLTIAESQTVNIEKADQCLRNAQTVVSELVTRDQDLLGVQILLGIVILFQNSRDPKPASVIIGTAVRLAHRLRLHSCEAAEFFPAAEAEQRSRVFWIAYTLDKDICLRANTPSCQFDDDVDIALPTLAPADSAGLIWTQNAQVHFNYHRRRVELAYIQGKVYDLLYSNRANKVKGPERQRRVFRLQAMLDQWYGRIPVAFHIDHVASTVGPSQLVQMCKMHHAFLLAEVMTHGIYSHNADWVNRVSSFSLAAIGDSRGENCGSDKSYLRQTPPLPEGWTKCVQVSRGCMKLFQEATPTECLIWQCSCAHFSALIILLANMVLNPGHESVSLDQHMAMRSFELFDKLLVVLNDGGFRALHSVVGELSQRADEAVRAHEMDLSVTGKGIFEGLNAGHDMPDAMPEVDFLPSNTVFDGFDGPFAPLETTIDFDPSILDQHIGSGLDMLDDAASGKDNVTGPIPNPPFQPRRQLPHFIISMSSGPRIGILYSVSSADQEDSMDEQRERQIASALRDAEQIPIATAAKLNGVPRSTLRGRQQGSTTYRASQVERQRLSPAQEDDIVSWILAEVAAGRTPSQLRIQQHACEIAVFNGDRRPISRRWIQRFFFRHPDIKAALSKKSPFSTARFCLCDAPSEEPLVSSTTLEHLGETND